MNEMDCMQNNTEETCDIKAFERNKYFYGKLMTVRDFETEQRYFNAKRSMLNRLVHGIGLVCGLEVKEAEIVDQQLRLRVSTGVALDCCGREMVIEDAGTYDVDGSPAEGTNYVYVKYLECLKEPVPAMSNPSTCEEVCCYSRIKESFKLELSQQAPPAATSFNWKEIWQERVHDIQDLASKLGISDPLGSLEAKLIVSADEYLKTVGCPSCDDPKALLAVVKVTGSSVEADKDETLALRSIVYNNPMIHQLLKSHLTDVDNPHQVTAEQTKALMSINNVGNAPDKEEWVQNVDVNSPDGTITVQPNVAANSLNINSTHAQIKTLPADPEQTDTTRDKHVSNADANRWNKAPVSIDGVANPGGNVDLVEGEGIKIEPNPDANEIKISATGGISGANTGIIQLTIPKATAAEQPGHVVSRGIPHGLETELSPAIILGLVTANGIIMEEDFITQRELIELMAKVYEVPAPPLVAFRALAVTSKTFDILAVNLNPEVEETIRIRWWAVPATKTIGGKDIGKITGAIRETLGGAYLNTLATEKNVAESEVNWVIGEMINAVYAEPSGVTITGISSTTGTKAETIQPAIEAMVAAGILVATGSGARRKYSIKG